MNNPLVPFDALTPERLIAQVAGLPLTAPFGDTFQYSNQLYAGGGGGRSELWPLADEAGKVAAYVFVEAPLAGVPAPVTLRPGADGRPELAVTVEGENPEATETYVLTLLEAAAAATPTP